MKLPTTPQFMRAALGADYGGIGKVLSVQDDVRVPRLDDEYKPENKIHPLIKAATKTDRKTHMIIKTLAVALAPGDCRVLSGKTRAFQGPPSFPYVPGGDCCGIVVETNPDDDYFQVGDVVAARFTNAPRDALGEYARVSVSVCEKIEDTAKISPIQAAALASASPATILADYIRPNERVLILGAGGGVGSHLSQLARVKGAAYVCGISRDPQRLLDAPISCDDAIDYTVSNIYESKKYQEKPFDTIIDLACGGWPALTNSRRKNLPSIVKPARLGGRYITICPDQPMFEASSMFGIMSIFLFKPLKRAIWSRINPFSRKNLPTFTQGNGLPDTREVMTRTLRLANEGKLEAVVDGPYKFDTEGVQSAFRKLESRHAKGKVVIQVADLPKEKS